MSFAAYLAPTALVMLAIHWLIQDIKSPLRSIPGPRLARFTRWWYFREVWNGTFPWTNIELHRKYGPIVRIAPNEYSIDDPEAVQIIYGHGTSFTKGPWYYASASPQKATIFSDDNPKTHATERRKFTSLYSTSTLMTMEQSVDRCIGVLSDKLAEFSSSGEAFDLPWWIQCFTFDTIGDMSISKRFGFLDEGKDPLRIIGGLDDFFVYGARAGIFPEVHPILFKLNSLFASNPFENIVKFANEQAQAYENDSKDETFLSKASRIHYEQPQKLSKEDILNVCVINVVAGSDTSGISLTSIIWSLIQNKHVFAKLRAEVDQAYSQKASGDTIAYTDSQEMPYLQAVIKEALRVHPATGLPLSRVVPKGGATISGRFFPEGAIVGINPWVAHHNRRIFGDDVHEFRPERWLVGTEQQHDLERYWLPFGHGSRVCIGKNIAHMELSKAVPYLVRHFDFALLDPQEPLKTHNVWFVKQVNTMVTVRMRKINGM